MLKPLAIYCRSLSAATALAGFLFGRRRRFWPVAIWLVAALGANRTFAANVDGDDTAATHAATPATAPAQEPTDIGDRPNLLDDWGGWRTVAGDAGFTPFANLTTEIWDNARGGIRDGMTNDFVLTAGFDADLTKLAGWPGATLHASLNWVQGQNPDNNTGAFINPSSIYASDQVRVFEVYVQDKLLDDQITLKVGQFGADDDFFLCDDQALYLNNGIEGPPGFGGQTTANGDGTIPSYPVDGPGAFVRYDPAGRPFYAMAGAYLSDPGPDESSNHGFDWRAGNGASVIGEAGWHYTLAGHDGTLAVGAFADDGQFTNWNTGAPQRGIYGSYATLEQAFLGKPGTAGGQAQSILSGFLQADRAGPNSRTAPNGDFSGGLNWTGPLPGRPDDVAGLAVIYTNFSPAYTRSVFNPNGPGVSTASETALECTYRIKVTPWFQLQPDAQVIFNPANAGTRATAVVFGVQAMITF